MKRRWELGSSGGLLCVALLLVAFSLYGCGGGGGGSGSSPVSPQPPTTTTGVEVTDTVTPLEMARIPVDIPGTVIGVQQVGGPAVSNLSYKSGVISFVAPAETGKDEILQFSATLADNSTVKFDITLATLIPPPIAAYDDGTEEGSTTTISDLTLASTSFVSMNILPASFTELKFSTASDSGAKISKIIVDLNNGGNSYDITSYFAIDAQTGTITLAPASRADFIAKLSDQLMELSIDGLDSKGGQFSYVVSFYYGSNTVTGKVVDNAGTALASLAGKTVLLKGFTSGVSQSAVISGSGTFSFQNVVTDNFSLTLTDPTGVYNGAVLFLIKSGGSTVNVNLTAFAGTSAGKVSAKEARYASGATPVTIKPNPAVTPFQRNKAIEPRNLPRQAPAAVPATTATSLTVVGAAENVTQHEQKKIEVPQGTKAVVIHADVTTAEYPGYTTKQGNKYNDDWRFWWQCGAQQKIEEGLVNNTHSTTGTRSYEYVVDLSKESAGAPVTCNIAAWTTNIGDGALPTSVTIKLEERSGLTIRKVFHKSGLFSDNGNGLYNMGIPLSPGTTPGTRREWVMAVEYKPVDAEITKMKVDLQYNGSTYTISDNQAFEKTIYPGQLKVPITLKQGIPLVPAGNLTASIVVTLTGKVGGVESVSLPKTLMFSNQKDLFQPLFEIRNLYTIADSRRFGDIPDPRQDALGGDGWGRPDMLTWLTSGPGTIFPFNDISGEHAWQTKKNVKGVEVFKSLGVHNCHKGGYDVDARYFDENGQFLTTMRGDWNGASIKKIVEDAEKEFNSGTTPMPNLTKLIKWIKANRTGLASIAAGSNIRGIYVGIEDWHKMALLDGKFASDEPIRDISLPQQNGVYQLLGAWSGKPNNIKPKAGGHEGHIHVRMEP